ncbi:HEAT repeat domain-containing protein [Mycolicibacterium sp. HS_4_1]
MNLEWLVAIFEPNLLNEVGYSSEQSALPTAELAKAMQRRILRSPFDEEISDPSVRAVYETLLGHEHALDRLIESLATEQVRQDLAKMTALTLVACALLAERDDVSTCHRIIIDALALLTTTSPSADLCRALILQQRALRNYDIGEPPEFDLNEVRRLLENIKFHPSPELAIGQNTDTFRVAALDNIVEALNSSAAGFDLFERAPDMGYVGADLEDDQLGQYRRWLGSVYETTLSRTSRTDYGADLYFENLRLEVLGHRDVYRSRKELATMRIVGFRPALPAAVAADGLRLFRLAGADSELRRLVDELTFAGPAGPLLTEGLRIGTQRTSERSLRTGEMIVLAAAAEVMPPTQAFQTLTRVLSVIRRGGPTTAPLHWQAEFSKDEEAWAAAAALAGAAGTAKMLAQELLVYATPVRLADISYDTVIAGVVRALDWEDITDDLRSRWHSLWSRQVREHPQSPTAAVLQKALKLAPEGLLKDDQAPLNELAESINHYLRTSQPIPDPVYSVAKRAVLAGLAAAAKEASGGTFVRRVISSAEVAAVLLTQFADDDIWAGLLEFLTNPLVARSEKSRAFDILTRERPNLNSQLKARYANGLTTLVTQPDPWAFDDSDGRPVFVAALSFTFAYGMLSDEIVADHLGALASSLDVQTRRDAGRSLSLLSIKSVGDWMLPKVYALSGDSDPTVRVAVAHALGEICRRPDVVGSMAIERLTELLRSGGVFVPLQTLNQLTTAALTVPQIDRVVRALRNDSQSWRVRRRAAQLLDNR